jgi:hypothetical protein
MNRYDVIIVADVTPLGDPVVVLVQDLFTR